MRFLKHKKNIIIVSLLTIISLLTGCDMVLMNPKGAIGIEQKKLILTTFSLMLLIIITVIFMTIVFAIKYRANNKHAIYQPDWEHSSKIEIVCWIIPIIIIIILAVITWKSTHQLDPSRPLKNNKTPITIQVISTDWKWIFIYPEQNIATINEISIPVDVPIKFNVTSESVMNSFFVPALGSQIYAMAGMQNKLNLIANKPGTYKGFSSSYSGHGFSDMKFNVIVAPNEVNFNKWIKKVKRSTEKLDSVAKFNQLAKPSYNTPITYFSSVEPNLYKKIILKFDYKYYDNFHVTDKTKCKISSR